LYLEKEEYMKQYIKTVQKKIKKEKINPMVLGLRELEKIILETFLFGLKKD